MHRTRTLSAGAVVMAAALVLTACSTSGGNADGEVNNTLRLGTVTPLASFAPWGASWANQSPYLQPVYDTLLRATPDGEVIEGLATDWVLDETKTVLTLTLRDDVTFSDGTALTGDVVAEGLLRFRDGTSENASFLAGVQSVEAPAEMTVVITLAAPDPSFPVYLTQNAGLVGAEAMWESADAQTTPIGTGPYELDASATVAGSSYTYEAKDDYWDPESVHYDEIIVTYYGDATSLMNAVKGGQVDGTVSQTPTQNAEAEAAGYTSTSAEGDWAGFLLVDRAGTLTPELGDVRVRQAINHALDRESLVQALAGGYGTPTTQVFAVDSDAYAPDLDERYPYSPDRARELLAEAGYANGFTLTMPSNDFVPEAEFALYAEQLGAVGIDVEWQKTGDDLFPRMLGASWSAFPFKLQTDPTAFQTAQLSVTPSATWNPFRTEDAQVNEIVERMRVAEPAEAEKIGQELNEYLVEQAWFAPVYRPQTAYFTNAVTTVELQVGNAYPYISSFRPAS
ncbi:peptide ABC transporter substrate-binding protein [Arthrobacter sp. Sa2CUA1]|uniref:Peptide ABC transporter substrate-binding protein n=1 Tax=Arthrobacter gallicola TaxID=2762225 RepID=A0ABR8USN4_9MICC|nr:ABC transporter substrate-binding protein [Arthrobacter gallicola]MBD7995540.1 peptide ABC transporter substrate-binding protein [Arthrobacter gallicola]